MPSSRTRSAEDVALDLVDADLIERASAGDLTAFEELYRRHAEAAWRVACSVTSDPHDAADAVADAFTTVLEAVRQGRAGHIRRFRSYLLTATRNAAIGGHRRRERDASLGQVVSASGVTVVTGPGEQVVDLTDQALAASAYGQLPERWQRVLWLTEVEGVAADEAAREMGVTKNGLSQLAHRARARLREGFVQQHLRTADPACRPTVERLGAYVLGTLSKREQARVDGHLASCEACRQRHEEVADLGTTLRRGVFPLPVGLGAAALRRWTEAVGGGPAGLPDVLAQVAQSAFNRAAVGAAALGIGVAGILGLWDLDDPVGSAPGRRPPTVAGGTVSPDEDVAEVVLGSDLARGPGTARRSAAGGAQATPSGAAAGSGGTAGPGTSDSPDPTDPGGTPPPERPKPLVQVVADGAVAGEADGTIAAGAGDGACNGARAEDQTFGCTEPEGDATRIEIAIP